MINKNIQNFSDAVFGSLNNFGKTVDDYGETISWFSAAIGNGCSIVYIQGDYCEDKYGYLPESETFGIVIEDLIM